MESPVVERKKHDAFLAIFILIFMSTMSEDVMGKGHILSAFSRLQSVLATWVRLMDGTLKVICRTFRVCLCLTMVSKFRHLSWNCSWPFCCDIYLVAALHVPLKETLILKLPPDSVVIVSGESPFSEGNSRIRPYKRSSGGGLFEGFELNLD